MVQPNSALPIRRRPPVVRTTLMNAAAAHRGLGTRMSQLANPGSAPQLQASHDAALRGVTIIVLWATLWFTRNFITSDKQFPVEATLPAVYLAGYLFVNRDELRILRLPFLVDSALASLASALFIDTALGEVLLPALTLVCGLQWAQMRVGFAVLCGLCYFGYYAVFGTPSAEPRHLGVQISTLVSIGIALALFMRANRILLGTRTAAQEHVTTFINKAKTVRGASGLLWLLSVLRPVVASTGVRGALVWLGAMFVDWHYRVSIGGLVTSSCLLIGFGASLAPERASGVSARTRYLYGVLLIVAVWACDVSVFLAVPSYTLPFISNCVLSAYCVLHMSTSPVHLPRVTTVASSGAVEITPAPAPFATPVLGSVMLWSFMILADLHVQIRLGWEEPSMGRIVVAVNTIGYGVLLLTSSFLDAFSRDARIRARMSYLAEEAISADAIALRQLVDDFEGVPDFDVALATAGIRGDIKDVLMDARFVSHHATSGLVLGQQSAFEASKDDEQPVASATTDTAAADSDESHSDASTTAHGTSTPSAAVIETKATRSPDQRSPTGSFNHVPNATAAVSQPAAPPRESAEDIAAREKARLEAEEARRKAKLAQKAEEKRLQDQRALEAAQRRERQRREQELKDISVNEKSARDVLVSLERSVRDRVSSDFTQEINAVHEAVQARRQREAAKKNQRAQNATPPAAVAPSPQPAPTTAPVLVTPAPKSTAKTASPAPEAQPPKPQPPAPKQTSKAASRSTSEPPAKVSASAATATNGQPKQQQQQQTKKNNADKAATAASKPVAEPVAKPAKEPAHKDGTQQSKGNRGWEAQAAQAAPTQSKAVPQAQQARLPEPKSSRAQHNGPSEVVPAPSRTPPSASAPRVAPLLTPAAPSKSPVEACDEEGDAVNLLLAALHRNNNNNSGAAMPTSTTSSKSAAAFSPVASTPVQSSFAAGQVASETSKVADDEDDAEDFMSFINDQVNNVLKDDDGSHRAAHHQARGVNDMDYHIGGSSSNGVNPAAPSFHMTSTPQSISPSLSPMRGPTQAHHQFGAPRAPMMEPTNFVAPMQPQYVAYSPQYVFVSPNGATAAQPQQMMYVQYIPYGGQMVPAYYVVPQGVVPTGPQPEEQVPPQM